MEKNQIVYDDFARVGLRPNRVVTMLCFDGGRHLARQWGHGLGSCSIARDRRGARRRFARSI